MIKTFNYILFLIIILFTSSCKSQIKYNDLDEVEIGKIKPEDFLESLVERNSLKLLDVENQYSSIECGEQLNTGSFETKNDNPVIRFFKIPINRVTIKSNKNNEVLGLVGRSEIVDSITLNESIKLLDEKYGNSKILPVTYKDTQYPDKEFIAGIWHIWKKNENKEEIRLWKKERDKKFLIDDSIFKYYIRNKIVNQNSTFFDVTVFILDLKKIEDYEKSSCPSYQIGDWTTLSSPF